MRPHHKQAIEKLTESLKKDEKCLAIIITGSVAKGVERDDSDIDIVLVVTDKEFERRKRRNRFIYFDDNVCDYPGGYIDGKIVDLQLLKTVAERGSEPARDAFRGAWIAFSKIPELEELFKKKIPVYQKEEKKEKTGLLFKYWTPNLLSLILDTF
ncbi:MAG: nucleotidyltransferase domain-containing protein [Promethearchaeota archaeon]